MVLLIYLLILAGFIVIGYTAPRRYVPYLLGIAIVILLVTIVMRGLL